MAKAILAVALLVLSVPAGAQEGYATAREAALRFALANGISLPTKDAIVAYESEFMKVDGRRNAASAEQLQRAATDLARAVGPSATAASTQTSLTCVKSNCVPKSAPVIIVDDPNSDNGVESVLVQVLLRSDVPEFDGYKVIVLVDVQERNGRWIGLQNRRGPTKVGVRFSR